MIGGTDSKRYPGFNGIITRVIFSDKLGGSYITGWANLDKLLA